MALRLHGELILDGNKGTVIVEGDTAAEAGSSQARAMAYKCAQANMSRPGVKEQSGPYAVDPATGEPYGDPRAGTGPDVTFRIKPGSPFRQDFIFLSGF